MEILWAVLVLGGMGLVFGVLLTLTSKVFAVPSNPTRDAVREVLPGANCGGCGYPGCDGCADAITAGKAPVSACPVGGAEVTAKVAKIMGMEADTASEKLVAHVICAGDAKHCLDKFNYTGIHDCVAASLVSDGDKNCKYACLGYGTCVRACPFDAIHIDEQLRIAVVDTEKCQSCGKCVEACPRGVLDLQPISRPVRLLCRAAEKGILVADNCKVGCIGCELCLNACKFGAITIVNHLPVIDNEKCRGCMMCAEACPTTAIWANWDQRLIAEIDQDQCVGCTMCKRTCKFNAVVGTLKQPHEITAACTGCGECSEKCPKKCITMKVREHVRDAYSKLGQEPETVQTVNTPAPKPAEAAQEKKPGEIDMSKYPPEVQAKIRAAMEAKAAKAAAEAQEKKD